MDILEMGQQLYASSLTLPLSCFEAYQYPWALSLHIITSIGGQFLFNANEKTEYVTLVKSNECNKNWESISEIVSKLVKNYVLK